MLTEALLEMYFFSELRNLFEHVHNRRVLRVLKPSAQREAWVGFDHGWVDTTLTDAQLLESLANEARRPTGQVESVFLGFFLQFKVVHRMSKRSKHCPDGFHAPYFRASVSLDLNPTTGLSQHATLRRIGATANISAYYALPMLFDSVDIYGKPDLNRLWLVPVTEAPDDWKEGERHFIVMQHYDRPFAAWCSVPCSTKVYSAKEWASKERGPGPRVMKAQTLLRSLKSIVQATLGAMPRREETTGLILQGVKYSAMIPESFLLVELGSREQDHPRQRIDVDLSGDLPRWFGGQ